MQTSLAVEPARRAMDLATERQQGLVHDHVRVRDIAIRHAEATHQQKADGLRKTRIDSLLGRNRALSQLSNDDWSVFWMNFVLMLLFWVIEVLPVIAKLMSGDSIYDRVIGDRLHAHRVASDGARSAEPAWASAGKRGAELRIETVVQEAEAEARARRDAITLHYQAVEDVRKAVQDAWRVPESAVTEGVGGLDEAARRSMHGAQDASGSQLLKQAVVDGLTKSSFWRIAGHGALPLSMIAGSIIASYYFVTSLSPFDKNALAIAVGVGAIVGGMVQQAPRLMSRFSQARAEKRP